MELRKGLEAIVRTARTSLGFNHNNSKPNRFWEDGKLVEEDQIIGRIMTLLDNRIFNSPGINLKNGPYRLRGVFLFGSIYKLKLEEKYAREPDSMGLYFWIEAPEENQESRMRELTRRLQIMYVWEHYGLPVHCVAGASLPQDNDQIGKPESVYPLYLKF